MTSQAQSIADYGLSKYYGGRSIGTWAGSLFILTLGMFHGTLLFSYFMTRHGATRWPPDGYEVPSLGLPLISTAIMLVSAIPMVFAYLAIRRGRVGAMLGGVMVTLALGIAFLAVQIPAYSDLDLAPVETVYSALIVALGGYHGVVMIVAFIMFAVVLLRGFMGHFSELRYQAVEALLLTWLFVVVSWLLNAGTIYLTPYMF